MASASNQQTGEKCILCKQTRKRTKKMFENAIPCTHSIIEAKIRSSCAILDQEDLISHIRTDFISANVHYHRTCFRNFNAKARREKTKKANAEPMGRGGVFGGLQNLDDIRAHRRPVALEEFEEAFKVSMMQGIASLLSDEISEWVQTGPHDELPDGVTEFVKTMVEEDEDEDADNEAMKGLGVAIIAYAIEQKFFHDL